jgi:hypothetical protein
MRQPCGDDFRAFSNYILRRPTAGSQFEICTRDRVQRSKSYSPDQLVQVQALTRTAGLHLFPARSMWRGLRSPGRLQQLRGETSRKTLACCKQSFCLCSIKVVGFALDIEEHRSWDCVDQTLDLSTEAFAYMTLPIVRGAPHSWTHYDDSDDYQTSRANRCVQHAGTACLQLSREEEMCVFLDPEGNALVVVFPEQICPSSGAALLEIRTNMRSSHSVLVACDLNGRKAKRHLVNGITIRLLGDNCQVFFSFQFMLIFNEALEIHRPCGRVVFQGTRRANYLSEPLLKLCS